MSDPSAADYAAADEYRQLIFTRTGLAHTELVCPREKSEMTPCIARDGELALCSTSFGKPICVGCEHGLYSLLEKERAKHGGPTT
jgi:hypothetical protein